MFNYFLPNSFLLFMSDLIYMKYKHCSLPCKTLRYLCQDPKMDSFNITIHSHFCLRSNVTNVIAKISYYSLSLMICFSTTTILLNFLYHSVASFIGCISILQIYYMLLLNINTLTYLSYHKNATKFQYVY